MTDQEYERLRHRIELLEATHAVMERHLRLAMERMDGHAKMFETVALMSDDVRAFMRDVGKILGIPDGDVEARERVDP